MLRSPESYITAPFISRFVIGESVTSLEVKLRCCVRCYRGSLKSGILAVQVVGYDGGCRHVLVVGGHRCVPLLMHFLDRWITRAD